MSVSIAAIIVTYNRLELLKETLSSIQSQSLPLTEIVVINNSSTDGTLEWLNTQKNITVITQRNVGGAGGFATGIDYAYSHGHDWIWCMDDDVVPMHDCLENLIKLQSDILIRTPLRHEVGSSTEPQDTIEFNFSNPFKSLWQRMFSSKEITNRSYIEAEGITFEGPLIHRKVVETIGLPDTGFFIFADDSDYFIRAKKHGFVSIIVFSAKMERKIHYSLDRPTSWKLYYGLRNMILLDMRYGNLAVKFFRPTLYFLKMFFTARSNSERLLIFKGYWHGIFQKTGKL
ncbi:MAG: glycosyltransferase family 2 protein [Bacteroidetes bacterium]|nr:glycosyltransferase family 2 protein [Bacteroidota bacterium]